MAAESVKTAPLKQKWYQSSLLLAITIGIPFCIFKYLFACFQCGLEYYTATIFCSFLVNLLLFGL